MLDVEDGNFCLEKLEGVERSCMLQAQKRLRRKRAEWL
jgi:hypothetical protein